MVLRSTTANDVCVYTVAGEGSRSLPSWLARKNKKILKHDHEYQTRVELLQDFEFPEAANCIRVSRDGNFAMATGTYKPQIRVFQFAEMSLKFSRHTNAENITFELLSDDWTKSVHLQSDRYLEFHSQSAFHYRTRIPKFGRDLKFYYPTAETVVSASGDEIYRLNLDQGRFLRPFELLSCGGNCIDINPAHQLLSFGMDNGTVEFWDPRYRTRIATITLSTPLESCSVTSLASKADGLTIAVGSSTGYTTLYDLRSPVSLLTKDQGYNLPIKTISFLQNHILTSDPKIIKIWDPVTGNPYTSIEPPTNINHVTPIPNSGMLFTANETTQMSAYYVPSLGPAPCWCSFLDSITEELEESSLPSVYENYKFVTRKELAALGLSDLVGTNVIRGYMHGYFLDQRLYEKAKLIANPFAYEEHREAQIRKKIEKERESRIRSKKTSKKVNSALAERLLKNEERKKSNGESVLEDSRFRNVFEDPDFAIDEDTIEYQQLYPTRSKLRDLTNAEESEEEHGNEQVPFSTSESDSDKSIPNSRRKFKQKKRKPEMTIIEEHKPNMSADLSFAMRLAQLPEKDSKNIKKTPGVGMEISFSVEKKRKKDVNLQEDSQRTGKRSQVTLGRRSASGNAMRRI